MEIKDFRLAKLPTELKWLVGSFVFVLSIGFFSGLLFVESTTSLEAQGVVENYNGNEENLEAEEMKFKKSAHELLNIIHTHLLSMSLIFGILGLLVFGAECPGPLKKLLMIEPLLSVLLTFGGIYLIWMGYEWMSWVVMISGMAMTLSFAFSILLIYRSLFQTK
jgi:hypothetical protein